MDNKTRFYIGRRFDLSREIISTRTAPTKKSLGHKYIDCLGPFDTKDAAEYMCWVGWDDPNCKSTTDAEQLVKKTKGKAA
jgi:hypothetical protein